MKIKKQKTKHISKEYLIVDVEMKLDGLFHINGITKTVVYLSSISMFV